MDEMPSGRHAPEGAEEPPGTAHTLHALTDPKKRPPVAGTHARKNLAPPA